MTSGHDECPACSYGLCPATRGEPRPPGCIATLPIAVLAGSRRQFDDFVRARGLSASHAVYVGEGRDARGLYFSAIERVGTWWRIMIPRARKRVLSRVRE